MPFKKLYTFLLNLKITLSYDTDHSAKNSILNYHKTLNQHLEWTKPTALNVSWFICVQYVKEYLT